MGMIIKIDGMSCQNCVRHVTEALEELEGVAEVVVDLDKKQANINPENIPETIIREAVEEAGYTVVEIFNGN